MIKFKLVIYLFSFKLLIEWGADVKSEDSSKEKPLDSMTHEYLKEELQSIFHAFLL